MRRIFLALEAPLNVAYALGALGGLRPCEIFSLEWPSVDLDRRRIFIRKEFAKDKDARTVPILDSLLPVLKEWKLKSGATGLVCPPLRRDGKKIDKATRGERLQEVLTALKLARPGLGWYEATRHTFASQWVLGGRSIEKLSKILGHYSIVQTEVYAHLRPDLFSAEDLAGLPISLRDGPNSVHALSETSNKVAH